jgi:hypothetical protein
MLPGWNDLARVSLLKHFSRSSAWWAICLCALAELASHFLPDSWPTAKKYLGTTAIIFFTLMVAAEWLENKYDDRKDELTAARFLSLDQREELAGKLSVPPSSSVAGKGIDVSFYLMDKEAQQFTLDLTSVLSEAHLSAEPVMDGDPGDRVPGVHIQTGPDNDFQKVAVQLRDALNSYGISSDITALGGSCNAPMCIRVGPIR